MDTIYDYLKADHEKVSELFKQFEKAPSAEAKFDCVSYLIKELLLHAESEAQTFYKELEKYPKSEDEAFHGEEEHQAIKDKITEILSINTPDETWENKVLQLKRLVEHHVGEEEGEIFSRAKKVLSEKQAYSIREQMHDLKEKLLAKLGKDNKSFAKIM